jgi:cation transport protein ChaC
MDGDGPRPDEGGLTREALASGSLREMLEKARPDLHLTTDEERAASIAAVLAERPEHGDGLWVFAYGSLIWNPAIHVASHRLAWAMGWHRSFCLRATLGRGTPERPGLMLGLLPGGTCPGVVLRIAEPDVEVELDLLWRRELVTDGYIPRWIDVEDEAGAPLGMAIAFTINQDNAWYESDLDEDRVIDRLATARGRLGTAAEYLFRTRDALAAMGVHDPYLDRLVPGVRARLRA